MYKNNNNNISSLNNLSKICDIKILYLLEELNINIVDFDDNGLNLIHYFIMNNNLDCITYLFNINKSYFKINTKNENISPLIFCIIHNNKKLFKLIYNLDLELTHEKIDVYGNNIFHYITMYSRHDFIDKKIIIKNLKKNNFIGLSSNDLCLRKLLYSLFNNFNCKDELILYDTLRKYI